MSVIYPLWCVVCQIDGFVGTRFQKPGTKAAYIEYCPSCGGTNVISTKVEDRTEHEKILDGTVTYEDLT